MLYLIFLKLLYFCCLARSQEIILGRCNSFSVRPVENFDPSEFSGIWYGHQTFYPTKNFIGCSTLNFTLESPTKFKIVQSQVYLDTNTKFTIEGFGTLTDPKYHSRINLHFPPSKPMSFWIVSTDYCNYSILWRCDNLFQYSSQALWVLTRELVVTEEVQKKIDSGLWETGLEYDDLKEIYGSPRVCK